MDCKSYIEKLLYTGFHKNTVPEIFESDLKELTKHCGDRCLSCTLVKDTFNPQRYYDLCSLKAALMFDLALMTYARPRVDLD